MAHSEIPRPAVKERLNHWVQTHPAFNFELPDAEASPEADLVDKARFKLAGKGTPRKKEKIWYLEYHWMSKDHHAKHKSWLLRNQAYTSQWTRNTFGHKFMTLAGAQDHFKTMRPTTYFNDIEGRDWRIRNTRTGEIYTLQQ